MVEILYWWILRNACNEDMIKDNKVWCYCSSKGFERYMPYMSWQKIRRTLKKVEDGGILVTGNFNKRPTDQTLWYAFSDKGIEILEGYGYDFSKMKNGIFKNEKSNINKINLLNIKKNNIKEENSVSDDTLKKGATDELFDKFWEAYGKKVRKEEAIREWGKLSADNRQKALDAIEAYKESKRYETRYMLDPVRYLRRKTWNDDFSTVNRKTFYDPQEGDSDEKKRFKVWMRTTYPDIENTDFPISYEDYMMLKDKYRINKIGEQLAYINENITRFKHRDVTWEIDNFLKANEED